MSKRSLTILLIISLAFNLAVLGSILWLHLSRIHHPIHELHRFPRIPTPPNLDTHNWDPAIPRLRSQYDSLKIKLMRELAQDPIQETTIIAILDSSLIAQNSLEKALGIRLLDIRKQMSAKEADNYFNARALQMEHRIENIKRMYYRRNKNEEDNTNQPAHSNGFWHPNSSETSTNACHRKSPLVSSPIQPHAQSLGRIEAQRCSEREICASTYEL